MDIEKLRRTLAEHSELDILRRVFFSSPDYIAFSRLSDGAYIDVNPGFERMVGHRREDVIGCTSFDIGLWPEEDGEQRKRYVELLRRDGMVKDYPGRLRKVSGEIIEVEASANIVEIGGEQVLIAIVRDVTARKRDERELLRLNQELREKVERLERAERLAAEAARRAQSESRRLDALLEAAPVGIVMADAGGRLLRMNSAHHQLWGCTAQKAESTAEYGSWKGWWADGSERQGRRLLSHEWTMARVLHGEPAPRNIVEIEPFDAPQTRRTILISGAPIFDAEGKIIGGVVAQMDITDRIHAEEALRQTDRRKDEFLAMLAHELRNPLAPISAAAELMGTLPLDQAQIRETAQVIARQVRHMTGLVDDLLDVSRVTRGLVTLKTAPQDLKSVVANAVEQVRPFIETQRHHLAIELAAEAAVVLGDRKRLVQIVGNLLNNAARYTPEAGHILIRMRVDDGRVILSVRDNGIGIAPELQTHMFELFTQAERTSDRSQGGLGIGLALVKSLVRLHGGTVGCFSEGMGRGSEFTVELPLYICSDAQTDGTLEPKPLPAPARGLRIVIVDDNRDAARILAMFLQAIGHEVSTETGPQRALELPETPDVWLLDIGLPDMDGNDLARMLRARPGGNRPVLIAITGYGQEHDRRKALAAGFDHHFVKPVDTARLAALLAEISAAPRSSSPA